MKKINDTLSVTYVGYYQPNVKEITDYMIFQTLQLSTTLTKSLSLSFNLWHQHNTTPYHQIKKNDVRSRIGLRYSF